MIIRIKNFQFRFYFSRLEKRVGACSQMYGNPKLHALLWDFDRYTYNQIKKSLVKIQEKYKLPNIMIVQSSKKGSYHAYSFTARPFREIIHILSDTPEIDLTYLRLGMVRGYYTLRITPRKNDSISVVGILKSIYPDEMSFNGLTVNEYLTSNKGSKIKKHKGAK